MVGPLGAWAGTPILSEGFNRPFHQPSRQGRGQPQPHFTSPQPALPSTLGSLDFSFQFPESFSFKDGPPGLQEEGQEGVFLRTVMALERETVTPRPLGL